LSLNRPTWLARVKARQQGVRAAFEGHDIEAAVKQGVSDSFPWPSEIRGAIWDGTREAIERR
jgi:hypothetical protein